MLSIIYGFIVGRYASTHKIGLAITLIPVVLLAVFVASVSYRSGAGVAMPFLALAGYLLGRVAKWYFSRDKRANSVIGELE